MNNKLFFHIQEHTGLDYMATAMYALISESTNSDTRTVDLAEADQKYRITEQKIREQYGIQSGKTFTEWTNYFAEKNLLQEKNGETKLNGYNPFDDNTLFVRCRKRGDNKWHGRVWADEFKTHGHLSLHDYEYQHMIN